jgi:hypothetical protein
MPKKQAKPIPENQQLELGFVFYEDASTTEPIADEDKQHKSNRNPPNLVFRETVKHDYLDRIYRTLAANEPLRQIDYQLLGIVGCSQFYLQDKRLYVIFPGKIPHSYSEYREYINLA